MSLHRVHLAEGLPAEGGHVAITGDEAQHAVRVKRLGAGDLLELLDGRGRVASATIEAAEKLGKKSGWSLTARIDAVRSVPMPSPAVHVRTAPPKGPRLEHMIDQLAQAGAASWGPLITKRTVVDPREGKLARLERVAAEASKQCGRAWSLAIEPAITFDSALDDPGATVLADASGAALPEALAAASHDAARNEQVTLLIGPEGGWEPRELERARAAGVRVARFGPHVMRVETAAVVASAALLAAHTPVTPRAHG